MIACGVGALRLVDTVGKERGICMAKRTTRNATMLDDAGVALAAQLLETTMRFEEEWPHHVPMQGFCGERGLHALTIATAVLEHWCEGANLSVFASIARAHVALCEKPWMLLPGAHPQLVMTGSDGKGLYTTNHQVCTRHMALGGQESCPSLLYGSKHHGGTCYHQMARELVRVASYAVAASTPVLVRRVYESTGQARWHQ